PAPPPVAAPPQAAASAPAAAPPHPLVTAPRPKPVASLRPAEPQVSQASVIELPPPAAPRADDPQNMIYELGYSGALLRRLREAKGLSIDDLAASTRIARRYLEAIEADEYAALPAATFVRGYLRSVARSLEVDPERLASGYMARMGR
ncbi:MAG: helix-turn-helix domain-containing protein, partial [Pseudomonadota bacterium]